MYRHFAVTSLTLAALLPLSASHAADGRATAEMPSVGAARPCFAEFSPPSDAVILAAGAYSGRPAGFQIDQSGNQAGQIDVSVNYAGKPVVLMLTAYDPTVWNIKRSPSTSIVAVYASGYHRQAIAGIDRNVPQLVSTYDNRGACGHFYATAEKLTALNPHARKVFGRAVDAFYPVNKGSVQLGDPVPPGSVMLGSSITVESFQDAKAPPAGPAGLNAAVQAGILRRATAADSAAWSAALRENAGPADVPPVVGNVTPRERRSEMFNAYVVLQPFVYPAGLHGAHAATFFVPKGVPAPTGRPGHSAVYDFNTLRCKGALCSVQEH